MSRVCQVTNKRTTRGYRYATRGIAKKNKGIGIKITGKTRRSFRPNLLKKRMWLPEEKRFITLRLSAHALRTIDKVGISQVVKKMRLRGESV